MSAANLLTLLEQELRENGFDDWITIERSMKEGSECLRILKDAMVLTIFPSNCSTKYKIVNPKKCDWILQYKGFYYKSGKFLSILFDDEVTEAFYAAMSGVISLLRRSVASSKGMSTICLEQNQDKLLADGSEIQIFLSERDKALCDSSNELYDRGKITLKRPCALKTASNTIATANYKETNYLASTTGELAKFIPPLHNTTINGIIQCGMNVTPFLVTTIDKTSKDEEEFNEVSNLLAKMILSSPAIPNVLCQDLSPEEIRGVWRAYQGGMSLMAIRNRETIGDLAMILDFVSDNPLCKKLGLSEAPSNLTEYVIESLDLPPLMAAHCRKVGFDGFTVENDGLSITERQEIMDTYFSDKSVTIEILKNGPINHYKVSADGTIEFTSTGVIGIDGNSLYFKQGNDIKWRMIRINGQFVKYGRTL